jgi:rubrerythrin
MCWSCLQETGDPVSSQPISNTVEMLQSAIISENHDSSVMYPEFARVAREEGLEEVAEWFDTLATGEGIHLRRFQHMLEDLPNM